MLRESGLLSMLQHNAISPTGQPLCVYGDPAYPLWVHLQAPFRQGVRFTPQMCAHNKCMSEVKVSVEWLFGDIKQLLDEVEHDSENYQGRGLCYLPKPKAEADNTNRGLDNFAIMRKPNPIIVLLYNYKCTSVETFHRTTAK